MLDAKLANGMKMKRDKSKKDVDAYLASIPLGARNTLEKLRKEIHAAAPEAEEGFSYGVPAIKFLGKTLVCFAAFKNHCGFYPISPDVLKKFTSELQQYETSKGTIRFSTANPLPSDLVQKIVKARLDELQS
jgi:uncharacterized protein YdhG (YjbR/CyaY superfamily)